MFTRKEYEKYFGNVSDAEWANVQKIYQGRDGQNVRRSASDGRLTKEEHR